MTVRVATYVAEAATKAGVAGRSFNTNEIKSETKAMLSRYNKIEKNIAKLNKGDE